MNGLGSPGNGSGSDGITRGSHRSRIVGQLTTHARRRAAGS